MSDHKKYICIDKDCRYFLLQPLKETEVNKDITCWTAQYHLNATESSICIPSTFSVGMFFKVWTLDLNFSCCVHYHRLLNFFHYTGFVPNVQETLTVTCMYFSKLVRKLNINLNNTNFYPNDGCLMIPTVYLHQFSLVQTIFNSV